MHPSASFSATVRVRLDDTPGAFARLASAIGEAGASLGAIDLVRVEQATKVRDVAVLAADAKHLEEVVAAASRVDGVKVVHVSDRTFLMHLGGKIEVVSRSPIKTRDDLSMAYTPGVARVSRAIAEDRERVWELTMKQHMVAIVTDGSAVLGLGDLGPEAAAAPARGARHTRLPRRPARHGDRRPCGPPERAPGGRQTAGGREDRHHRCRRRGHGGHEDLAVRRCADGGGL